MRLPFALLCLLGLLTSSCFAQFQFEVEQYSGVGGNVRVDLNGDGKPDIFLPASGAYVRLNDGHGSFAETRQTATDQFSATSVFMDFNADGKQDVASCFTPQPGDSRYLAILLGNGDGTFGATEPLSLPGDCIDFALADFDRDGHLDLAALWEGPGPNGQLQFGLTVFYTDGHGGFLRTTTQQGISATSSSFGTCSSQRLLAGDFDGDGIPDVLLSALCSSGVPTDSVLVFGKGDGTGTFAFGTTFEGRWGYSLAKDDVNQDGWLDLVALAQSSSGPNNNEYSVQTLISPGKTAPTQYQGHILFDYSDTNLTPQNELKAVLVADIDGDGIKDAVFVEQLPDNLPSENPNYTFNLVVLRGRADGTYDPPVKFAFPGQPYAAGLVSGDFDRDGRIDLAAFVGTGFTVFLNRTTGAPTCAADPLVRSVKVCAPAKLSSNSLHLLANTTDSTPITGMKVYVDNTLELYSPNELVNKVLTVLNGGHRLTVRAWDAHGSFSSARWIDVNTNFGCTTPSTDRTIHYCFPTSSSTVGSPTQVVAAVRSSRTYYSTKIYVDGVLKYSTASKQLSTTLSLPVGTHHITVQAHDTGGYFSSTASATVR